MKYTLRPYQQEASDAAVAFFRNKKVKSNGLIIAPTGSGKSLIIADIAYKLGGNVLVLQPSKEILKQNFNKLKSYGVTDCSIYSASLRQKKISRITFGMIGSIMAHIDDFDKFVAIIVDEAHNVNAAGGQYKDFFEKVPRKVLGLTATPYRLYTQMGIEFKGEFMPNGSYKEEDYFIGGMLAKPGVKDGVTKCILKFLTRTRPRIFGRVIYNISIQDLMKQGFLSHMQYFPMKAYDASRVRANSTGRDYDERSLQQEYERSNVGAKLVDIVKRLLHPKRDGARKGILVFTSFLWEARSLANAIPECEFICGDTKPKERERIIKDFTEGKIKVLSNVGILTTGFDYPALDTIVIDRPTKSLALYYQIVGRAWRPYNGKTSWIVDLTDNYERFGRVENLVMCDEGFGKYYIKGFVKGEWKQLTNTYFD